MRSVTRIVAGCAKDAIVPESGAMMLRIIRIVVVLPAPLGPRRP